jgi:hypothetical protein
LQDITAGETFDWRRSMIASVQRTILAVFISLVAVTSGAIPAMAANEGCVANGAELTCPLQIGSFQYSVNSPQTYVRLTNSTGQYVQLNWVGASPVVSGYWGEICTFLDSFVTAQPWPGIGEVGCTTKEPWESAYPGLTWDGIHTALSVPTNSSIYLGGNTGPGGSDHRHTYTVVSYPQSAGVYSWRQPQADPGQISCSGADQWSAWTPWQNATGHNLAISGATIFAAAPVNQHVVDAACLYILNVSGTPRWMYCTGINQRGTVYFGGQAVAPGEWIAGQARHHCAGGGWNWAAYIHTYNIP